MSLTRDDVLAPCKLHVERVPAPEKGGDVFVRVMTGTERDAYERDNAKSADNRINFRGRFLVRCLCDENGELLLRPEDADALGKQPTTLLDRAVSAALRINRMTNDALEDEK